MKRQLYIGLAVMLALFVLQACEPTPQQIHYGSDQCEHCRMLISEPEFGSQLLNIRSRSFKFDSIECLAAFELNTELSDQIHSRWVPNFLNSNDWIDANHAVYLQSETLRSPMGLFLTAYSDSISATAMQIEYGGKLMDYRQVMELVGREWFGNTTSVESQEP